MLDQETIAKGFKQLAANNLEAMKAACEQINLERGIGATNRLLPVPDKNELELNKIYCSWCHTQMNPSVACKGSYCCDNPDCPYEGWGQRS